MVKITLKREKHIIYIFKGDNISFQLRYDLIRKVMEKFYNESQTWKVVQHQYEFFTNTHINEIVCDEPQFKYLIELTRKMNPDCISISTFITRMPEAMVYENYKVEGIQTECYIRKSYYGGCTKDILTKPLDFYTKNTIKFFKTNNLTVTKRLEQLFINDYNKMTKLIDELQQIEITNEEKMMVFNSITRGREHLTTLINEHKYDFKSLLKYIFGYLIPFENLDFDTAVYELEDYYRMAKQIGRDVKKYPKYLRSMHDIITSNYNAYSRHYSEQLFKNTIKPELEYEDKEYCIINPQTPKDIIKEGTDLNHCVGSYVDKILKGETYIFFLRQTKEKDKSLITLEFKKGIIVQAKGAYNRHITEEEKKFLESYAKKQKIKVEIC